MLARAAAKRLPRDILRSKLRPSPTAPYTAQLPSLPTLPWLYPTTLSRRASRPSSTATTPPSRPATKPLEKASEPVRHFQTNAAVLPDAPYDDGVSLYGTEPVTAPKPLFVPQSFIILDPPERPNIPAHHHGHTMLSEKSDILSSYYVCVQAGQLARGQLILKQIHTMLEPDDPELTSCHNTFLNSLLQKAQEDKQHLKLFFMWYEERMRAKYQVAPNAETISLLLKGSLLQPDEAVGQVYLRNYVKTAHNSEIPISEVLAKPVFEPAEVKYIAKATQIKWNELSEEQRELLASSIEVERPAALSVSEVIPTAVKGHGLAAIKQSLRSLIDPDYIPGLKDPTVGPVNPLQRQKLLEEDAIQSSLDRWRKDFEQRQQAGVLSGGKNLNAMLYEWHTQFVPLIRQELGRIMEAEKLPDRLGNGDRCMYGPYMRLLSPEKLSVITMLELIKVCNEGSVIVDGVKTSKAVVSVGNMLESEVLAEEIQKSTTRSKELLSEAFSSAFKFNMFVRRERIRQAKSNIPPEAALRPEWPTVVKVKLGAVLISMLIHCAKISINLRRNRDKRAMEDQGLKKEGLKDDNLQLIQPAFLHNYQYVRGKKLGVIKLNSELVRRLGAEPLRMSVISRHLPMIVAPRPWMGPRDGGYYYSVVKAVRTKDSREQDLYVNTAAARGDLEQLFAGLDVLGSTSWAINEKIFQVILDVWNSGIALAEIPPRELQIEFPPEPEPTADPLTRARWTREMKIAVAQKSNHHSLRCDVNFKLEIARAFLKEKLYFPHNIDFRGRAYPIPPHLNHIGNDLCRGLLMFHEGKELGATGLKWLRIHLSNVYGFDKASFKEREQFSIDHMDDINDSVQNPLTGKKWWLQAEDPWQCLAACFALSEAMLLEDPTKYKCQLPVAQDGTCNGLQHYAALGGDEVGARQVNLEPSDRPQDVYTGVATLVKEKLKQDAEAGNEMAIRLINLITRKVVKQTVMTNVYGVTFIGAKDQIYNQLKELPELEDFDVLAHATYVTRKVFECVRSMFTGAHNIQDWLGKSAWRISRSLSPTQMATYAAEEADRQGKPLPTESKLTASAKKKSDNLGKKFFYMASVVWTTPLGLPVVQPYRQKASQLIATHLQNLFISDPNIIDEVNSRKQMTAFPPNYIHSLDATHMLLSALECHKTGLTFAAVHDSFWTHPSDVDTLNRILRDAFINLHSSDLITKLYEEFTTRYAGYKYLASFPETSRVGARIRTHRLRQAAARGKALTASEELVMEMERDSLLRSEDPEEQERGRNMVTAASIAEAAPPEHYEADTATELEKGELKQLLCKSGMATDDMTEQQSSSSQPQVVMLGSEEEVPDAAAEVEGLLQQGSADVDNEGAQIDGTLIDESVAGGEDGVKAKKTTKKKKTKNAETEIKEGEEMEEEETPARKKKPKKRNYSQSLRAGVKVNVWMALTFPPVPKKGEFDVTRLEHSQYFFS
ncbi:hypothetical protein BDZ91DRAFT_764650 [Kalaharituber pfeilii]|nr:hypothetical protein BDZ91DRAFT_764650 [Kalaharituber pfeilii]